MQEPSKKWKLIRRAALEHAFRKFEKPLEPLLIFLLICSSIYLSGFIGLAIGEQIQAFNLLSGFAVSAVAISGLLVPFVLVSAITLFLATRNLRNLLEE